jgi:NAD(P)-dependent dehydrogenase (short-subunit alcohol dehydrogenase family)
MATILITGSNRGIGLELARQYSARGDKVIAACRRSSDDLAALDVQVVEGIDVSTQAGVEALRSAIADEHIDVLLSNAGILRSETFGKIDYESMLEQYRVNTLGPLRVVEALADKLGHGSKVAIVSSRVGSIEDNGSGGNYGYRASKAAVNQVGKNLEHELKPRGVAVALLHPGLVATEMTGGSGIEPADAARGLIERIDQLDLDSSGGFWHAEGYRLPW